ncbi:MAG: outer membrane beta-barrel protein [Vicinamibacteria bacterium]
MKISSCVRPFLAAAVLLSAGLSAEAQTWNGFYLGGQVGGVFLPDGADAFVTFDTNLDGGFGDTVNTAAGANAFSPGFCPGVPQGVTPAAGCTREDSGVDFGGRVGYDWQSGSFVYGLVGEVSAPDITDSLTAFSTTPASYTFTRELKTLGSLGLRVGYGGSKLLVYGTGAVAYADLDRTFGTSNRVNTFVQTVDDGAWGYRAGGGVEYKLNRLSLGAEYLFTSVSDTDRFTVRSQGPAPATNPFIRVNPAGTDLQRSDDLEFQSVRLTVSYRF